MVDPSGCFLPDMERWHQVHTLSRCWWGCSPGWWVCSNTTPAGSWTEHPGLWDKRENDEGRCVSSCFSCLRLTDWAKKREKKLQQDEIITCSWAKSDTWRKTQRGWLSAPAWTSHIHLYTRTCGEKQEERNGELIFFSQAFALWPLQKQATYFACLFRSITLTFPKTSVRYNLYRRTHGSMPKAEIFSVSKLKSCNTFYTRSSWAETLPSRRKH